MALMSAEEARQIGDEFRPRFSSPEAFETSWKRCFERLKNPSAESARRWLREDLAADGVMAVALEREPLLPQRSRYAPTECVHCGGIGYVRQETSITSASFGVAHVCPACSDPDHGKTGCKTCRTSRFFSSYFGPDTAVVPADWSVDNPTIPEGWEPRHTRVSRRGRKRRTMAE